VILLDTSFLIDAMAGSKNSAFALRHAFEQGELILVPALVLYEWLRGPRVPPEIAAMEALFPVKNITVFGHQEAIISARLYRSASRPRGREIDLAIAACAIARDAELWTLNPADFKDLPGLRLRPPARKH
jgi:predicted nucleic acid-binding protein